MTSNPSRSGPSRALILVTLVGLAAACYAVGFGPGGTAFLIAGGAFELAFWVGLFRGERSE